MAGALTGTEQRIAKPVWLMIGMIGILAACDRSGSGEPEALPIPERQETTFITDQVGVAGKNLFLWDEEGRCKLQIASQGSKKPGEKVWLKPMAPCYFIKSPGSRKVQVFQQDKTTRIIAVLGTPVVSKSVKSDKRCGREVQGLIVNANGKVRHSSRILSGSVYCDEQGLDNFQYSLFHDS